MKGFNAYYAKPFISLFTAERPSKTDCRDGNADAVWQNKGVLSYVFITNIYYARIVL